MSESWWDSPKPEKLSRDRARTARRKGLLAAGIHPLIRTPLGPPGTTCGTCSHLHKREYAGVYWKCDLVRMTGGPGSDVRKSWPGCQKWKAKP